MGDTSENKFPVGADVQQCSKHHNPENYILMRGHMLLAILNMSEHISLLCLLLSLKVSLLHFFLIHKMADHLKAVFEINFMMSLFVMSLTLKVLDNDIYCFQ